MDLPEHVSQTIRRRRLLFQGQRLLVAVSGGVDSMVLLQVLAELSKNQGWQLMVAHLNHQLRGRSSDADERLVRRTASQLLLPVVAEGAEVRRFAMTHKLSLEMAARMVRHDFLVRTASQRQIRTVALAHHADDQLELFFLRLFRGSGGDGLAGMKWRSASPSNSAVELVRPLLDLPKATLRAYAREKKIRFREDASNACRDIHRNRLRHELLPLLRRKYQPALDQTILRVMDIVGAEAELVTEWARGWMKQMRIAGKQKFYDHKAYQAASAGQGKRGQEVPTPFDDLPVAVQRRCIQLQLLDLGMAADFDLVERLRSCVDKPMSIPEPGVRPRLSAAAGASRRAEDRRALPLAVVRDPNGCLKLNRTETPQFNPAAKEIVLAARAGEGVFDGVKIQWRVAAPKTLRQLRAGMGRECFDADRVGSHILMRHWQPGDRFQPIGMGHPIKLQDFFMNEKISRSRRHQLVVGVTAQGELFWVEGLRISERFKLTKGTIRHLQWGWHRL